MENKINLLCDAIKNNSRPKPPALTAMSDNKFKKEYFKLNDQLFKLLEIRNKHAIDHFTSKKEKDSYWRKNKKKNSSRFQWYNPFSKKKITEHEQLDEAEKILFFKEHLKLTELKEEQNRCQLKADKLEEEITMINERKAPIYTVLKKTIDDLKLKIKKLENEKISTIKEFNSKINTLKHKSESNILDLKEGFNLGTWHRNKMIERPDELSPQLD